MAGGAGTRRAWDARLPGPKPRRSRGFLFIVLILLALNWLLLFQPGATPRVTVPFSPYFLHAVRSNQVASISSKGDTVEGILRSAVRYPASSATAISTRRFSTEVPAFANDNQLAQLLESHGAQINATSATQSTPLVVSLLLGFGPTLLLVGLSVLLFRRAAGGGAAGALGGFGRSQARRIDPARIRVMFDDVAGIDESKMELKEIVDFLRDPGRHERLGGRMPFGVLLPGAPGTDKTLLARAVAGEASAAFFSIAASEFIEAIPGVGASRTRDLFSKARAAAPAIVFIDELDAIGRSRSGSVSLSGSNDEREQTLNQVLTEMDGFEPVEAAVVLAATNWPEILDAALLRPGRFDRRVAVPSPVRSTRARILQVHTRSIPLGGDVDVDALASSTPGMVGSDLANLCNEVALLASRPHRERVEMRDFTDSLEKLALGTRRGIVLCPLDRERTAFHEAGHALVGMLTPEG